MALKIVKIKWRRQFGTPIELHSAVKIGSKSPNNPQFSVDPQVRLCYVHYSSLANRRAHNPKISGSNPLPATKIMRRLDFFKVGAFVR